MGETPRRSCHRWLLWWHVWLVRAFALSSVRAVVFHDAWRVVLVDEHDARVQSVTYPTELTHSGRTLDNLSGWQVCFKKSNE